MSKSDMFDKAYGLNPNDNKAEEEKKLFQKLFDAEMMRADEEAIKETAKTLYIFYDSLKEVGFSQQEAFSLLIVTITGVKAKG